MRYITSVNIPAINAQSVQITANARAFSRALNEFELVSPSNKNNTSSNIDDVDFSWKKINLWFKTGRLKYLEFCIKALYMCSGNETVYTRDILIALLFFYFRKECVVYEAHQKPSKIAAFIIRMLRGKEGFKVVTISNALKDFYIGTFDINETNILVAHDGIDINVYEGIKEIDLHESFSIDRKYKILMHSGSLYKGRGAELFLPILERYPELFIFHVGGSQEIIDYWTKKISNNRFKAISHVQSHELVSYQVSADYLLYPMLRETKTYWCCSPMKMFEYMASGVPIISTNIGSIKEVLNDKNAFTFDPDDSSTLWSAIDLALENELECMKRSNEAFENVKNSYTWEIRANAIKEFIVK